MTAPQPQAGSEQHDGLRQHLGHGRIRCSAQSMRDNSLTNSCGRQGWQTSHLGGAEHVGRHEQSRSTSQPQDGMCDRCCGPTRRICDHAKVLAPNNNKPIVNTGAR